MTIRLTPQPIDFAGLRLSARPAAGSAGAFVIERVPAGRYLVSTDRIPAGGYLREVLLNGRPLAGALLDAPGGGGVSGLELRVAFDGATITGKLSGVREGRSIIVALPEDQGVGLKAERIAGVRNTDGLFIIAGVAPGAYSVFALPADHGYDLSDGDARALLRKAGRKIRLAAREQAVVDPPWAERPASRSER